MAVNNISFLMALLAAAHPGIQNIEDYATEPAPAPVPIHQTPALELKLMPELMRAKVFAPAAEAPAEVPSETPVETPAEAPAEALGPILATELGSAAPMSGSSSKPALKGAKKKKTRLTRSEIKELQKINMMIEDLFDALKICDDADFDIDDIIIPESWTEELKTIMILKDPIVRKVIPKSDLERYERVLENCDVITKRIANLADEQASLTSQVSGVTYRNPDELKKKLGSSLLDDMKERLYYDDDDDNYYYDSDDNITIADTSTSSSEPAQPIIMSQMMDDDDDLPAALMSSLTDTEIDQRPAPFMMEPLEVPEESRDRPLTTYQFF